MNKNALVSQIASSYTNDVAYATTPSGYIEYTGKCDVVSITQSLASDGTVVVGVGYANSTHVTPASGKGVPSNLLSGYTELLLGSGRDNYGQFTSGPGIVHGQTIVVGLPHGVSLSAADRLKIENYLLEKWGCNQRKLTNETQAPPTPQPGPYSPPSSSSFVAMNAATLTLSGGGSSPLTLKQPAQPNDNLALELIPLTTATTLMFTTFLNFTIPYTTDANEGVALYSSKTGYITAFGVHYTNVIGGSFELNSFSSPTKFNTSLAHYQRVWYASIGKEVWIRVTINSTTPTPTITYLTSKTGRVDTWDTLFTITNSGNAPTHIGYYVDAYSTTPNAPPTSMNIIHLDPLKTYSDPQAAAGPYYATSPHEVPSVSQTLVHKSVRING
jgi:hypothetical protein